MRLVIAAAAALACTSASAEEEPPGELYLVCAGVAKYMVSGPTDMQTSNEVLRLRFDDERGKINLPVVLVPPMNSGGVAGWWTFSELAVDDELVVGKFKLNLVNKPRVTIDRRTGDINVKGFGMSFSGICERSVDDLAEPKF